MGGVQEFVNKSCDTYTGYSYDTYKQLRGLGNITRGPYNEASRSLRRIKGGIPSPPGMVDSALWDLEGELNSQIPDLSDPEQIADIIAKCSPLGNLLSGLGSLTDATDYMTDMVSDISGDIFSNATSGIMSGISEFLSGLNILNIQNLFGSLGLDKVLGNLDGLLDCISNMCPGPGTDDIIWAVEQLQDEMLFTDDGKFDTTALLSDIGIGGIQASNVTNIESSMTAMTNTAKDKMESQVKTLFNNVKKAQKSKYLGKISSYF